MLRQVRCECGYLARANSDDDVIALILAHIATDHPALAETETADDIRSMIELIPELPDRR
jgi:predicted small metal-binding protein